jgi:putative peptide zinc metalloprotease protein
LTFFGSSSGIYRVVVFSSILLAVADRFLIIGMVMAAICLISWMAVPVAQFTRYLAASPRLDRVRTRAVCMTAGLVAIVVVLLAVIPFPCSFRAPGIVMASQRSLLVNETAGCVAELRVKPGSRVKAGQALVQLKSPELELELADTKARLDGVTARLLQAMQEEPADVAPLSNLRDSVRGQMAKLTRDYQNLTVRAPHDGIWVAPEIEDEQGSWLRRGSNLGLMVDLAGFNFVATVMEEDVNALFARFIRGAQVRLRGEAGRALTVTNWQIVPGGQKTLPSAALGWAAGGAVPVATENDTTGTQAVEPFFEVRGHLERRDGIALLDGRSGEIRFKLAPEPLLPRWIRLLRQLFQKRYKI